MDIRKRGKFTFALMLVASAFMCLLVIGCFRFLRDYDPDPETPGAGDEYATLLRMINDLYIGEYDESEIHEEALRALAASLDEWSFYMTADEYESFLNRANNQYTGIGVEVLIDEETEGMRIVGVFPGAPAELGGVLIGDVITHIDGENILGYTIAEMRDMLARPIGDYAVLTILRDGENDLQLTVMYGEVFVVPVKYEMIEDNIGYIQISNFDAKSADAFINAVEELIGRGAVSFIYDVRGNSGGRVTELTMMLDYLLPEGEIFIQIDRRGNEQITTSDEEWLDMPAVVLVDRHSYSAAEYFAALLGEYGYAETVGEQTTGKSRSQTTHMMPGGGALHISTGQYMTKNRVSLHDAGGLTPDYLIEFDDEEYNLFLRGNLDRSDDAQFNKAVSLLMG